ncbi:hypothetical protein [Primorskyibacter sp. 2E233]|uniref:hypothetical protein n=1 Tax=Primorskyibacter sp. 2E233 TaxID=3413431 RepID=UPI003BF1EE19
MLLALKTTAVGLLALALFGLPALSQTLDDNWLEMDDDVFAQTYADMAFGEDLKGRKQVAWMWFARVDQQIAGADIHTDKDSGTAPIWMAWATDPETFTDKPDFAYTNTPRDDPDFVTRNDILAGQISTKIKDGALVFKFTDDDDKDVQYWWAKMRALPRDPFDSDEPSWFWTTFEFTNNPGVQHIRKAFMTETPHWTGPKSPKS